MGINRIALLTTTALAYALPLLITQVTAQPRTAIKLQWPALMIAALLFGCARPEDSSFGVQAARRGENCSAIATGSAMDAYGHGVGPAENVYEDVKRDCLAWQQRERERLNATKSK